jgi:hypothetical protein
MADLSKLSDKDLEAITRGDMSAVSDEGLQMLANEPVKARPAPGNVADMGSLGGADAVYPMPSTAALKRVGGIAADMGLEGGGAAAGQAMGVGLGVPGMMVGGAIGGAGGNILSQARQIYAKERSKFSLGEVAGAATAGAVPGAPLARAGGKVLAKEAAKQAGANVAAKAAEMTIDRKEMTLGDMELAALAGVGGIAAGKFLDRGAKITASDARRIEQGTTDQTVRELKAAGYPVVPSQINPSFINKLLESVAGKADTAQEIAKRSQEVTKALAQRSIGVPVEAPITMGLLERRRTEAFAPYEEIATFSKTAARDLDALKKAELTSGDYHELRIKEADPEFAKKFDELQTQAAADIKALSNARSEMRALYKDYDANGTYAVLQRAKEQEALAEELEGKIEKAARLLGRDDLIPKLEEARTLIARTWDIERALHLPTNSIEASILYRAYDKGKPLGGGLETIAKAGGMPKVVDTRVPENVPTPGVSNLRVGMGAGAGAAVGGHFGGAPGATLGAMLGPVATMGISNTARNIILSPRYQHSRFVAPFYPDGGDFAAEAAKFGIQAQGR